MWQSAQEAGGTDSRRSRPELARIGTWLRALYEPVAEEAVPDRLKRLLDRLHDRRA
jgi:hypothetical protein